MSLDTGAPVCYNGHMDIDLVAWEAEARKHECPVCKSEPGDPCTRYPGHSNKRSHAVRGKHRNGRRIPV